VVGGEIPNRKPEIVYFKSIVNSERFTIVDDKLVIALGKTANGEPFVFNLAKMPHLLIAGTTGSGKSVCINTLLMSVLYRAKPSEVKFILIDPKKLELSVYKALKEYHLITNDDIGEHVITRPQNAVLALRSAEVEMERRYTVLANATVRNIDEYNKKVADGLVEGEHLPYLLIVIDELADLMLTAGKEIEEPIARLAQMARAVGIHLVIATQRPSVDVITGVIRSNFPARIGFQVPTKIDSRTILDTGGAEKLLGKGDMLFLSPGRSEPIRIHNAFITLEEIERVMDHINEQPGSGDDFILPSAKEEEEEEESDDFELSTERDPLFEEALKLVVMHQQGSISLIQRRLRVGYSRAARLIDELEREGIVGPFTGSKAREVLVDTNYLEHLKSLEDGTFDEEDDDNS
jgi:S-DNA-T family DNA segregation ATPase FtsK/SpoIIIE